jgi:hypothetical protein
MNSLSGFNPLHKTLRKKNYRLKMAGAGKIQSGESGK